MTKVQEFLQQNYIFSINYWFRYTSHGEMEKDFENVKVTARNFEEASQEIIRIHDRPNAKIFSIELKKQTPTITKSQLFFLTNPKNARL
jgi:hypothetical protein